MIVGSPAKVGSRQVYAPHNSKQVMRGFFIYPIGFAYRINNLAAARSHSPAIQIPKRRRIVHISVSVLEGKAYRLEKLAVAGSHSPPLIQIPKRRRIVTFPTLLLIGFGYLSENSP